MLIKSGGGVLNGGSGYYNEKIVIMYNGIMQSQNKCWCDVELSNSCNFVGEFPKPLVPLLRRVLVQL